jgi:predicted AlkP superfamily phosphohydrolase/phosphomutase
MHGSGRYYLEPLFAAGRMPQLRALADEGHQRYFRSEMPLAAGAWVTLLTGQSVGVHGVLDYIDLDARAYDGLAHRHASSAQYSDQTIHTVLSRAGRRVASIYLPMTSPPWAIDGMIVSGFPLKDERRPETYPAELADRLPPFSPHKLFTLRYEQEDLIDDYLRYNLRRIEDLTRATCRERYDVVLSCLPTPDIAHHYFWRPDDPSALERIYGYYDEVDAVIGRIVQDIDDQTTVVVLSDHGGRAAPARTFGVSRWLADEGYLTTRRSVVARPSAIRTTNRILNWGKRMRLNHLLAPGIRGGVRRRVSALTHNTTFIDWSRSRAYGLDFVCPLAGVEINLQNRQPAGIVATTDYEPLRREIIARLEHTADPDTGKRVFQQVLPREEIFHGPHLDRFPDVVGVLTDDYDVKAHLDLPAIGPNPGQWDYPFLGYHGCDAFFAARGPAIRRGSTTMMSPMFDVAPTMLALAGVEPPAWMEGRPFDM